VQRYVFNVSSGCLTLPREILTIEGAQICRNRLPVKNQWYEIQDGGPGWIPDNANCLSALVDRGDGYCCFADICPGSPRKVRVYADVSESSGATILIQGYDENGNRVRTSDGAGGYVDGELVTLNNATPQLSQTLFSAVDGLQKDATKGFIRLYAYDPDTTTQSILSILHPDDTLPSLRRYFMPGLRETQQMMIVAVLRYLPVTRDTDFLTIENLGALKNMVIALRHEEANNFDLSAAYEAKAVSILNQELRNYTGLTAIGQVQVQMPGVGAGDIAAIL
jgi:hypothetical protein